MKLTSLVVVKMTILLVLSIALVNAQTKPRKRAPVSRNSTVSLEAKLSLQSNDIMPVARTTFYLLNNSLAKILKDAGVKLPRRSISSSEDSIYVSSFGMWNEYTGSREDMQFIDAAMKALKPHIIQSITTDLSGKAKFSNVPVGTYYVMGTVHVPGGFVVWNLKVDLNSPQASVILSRDNSAYALIP